MASSSDDEPNLADLLNRHKPEGSQDSDLPAWIQAHTPVKVPIDISGDSDDEATAPAASKAAAANGAPGSSKAAAGSNKAAAAGSSEGAGSSKAAAAAAAVAAGTNIQLPGSTPQQSGAAAVLPAVAVLSGVGDGTSQIPVILPEKLVRNKVLVELEPAPHQATELSGDAGAVGRIIVDAEAAADGCFKVDLKGVLYQATVLPLAGTALIANIGPTEAKIEGVLGDFVRLREETDFTEGGMLLEGGGTYNELMADDEDNYQMGDDGRETAAGKAAMKKAAAAKRKPGAKGVGAKAGAGKALKAVGGVKKKAAAGGAKKAAGGKGSRTPSKAKKPKAAAAGGTKAKAAAKAMPVGGAAKGAGKAAAGTAGKGKGGTAGKKGKKKGSEWEVEFDSDSEGADGGDSDWSVD